MSVRVRVEQQYTRQAAADLLSVSLDTVDKLVAMGRRSKNGLYPIYRVGNSPRIPESALQRYLEACRVK